MDIFKTRKNCFFFDTHLLDLKLNRQLTYIKIVFISAPYIYVFVCNAFLDTNLYDSDYFLNQGWHNFSFKNVAKEFRAS